VQSGQHALRLRTVRPDTTTGRRPVIMYFHGAGWVMGDATTHDRLVRELAVGANATVVFLDYDRAPEHRYPVAIELRDESVPVNSTSVCICSGVRAVLYYSCLNTKSSDNRL
jgi:hypothetical protein